ncbi:hypothetical protein [Mariniblastus fucicola]|uniref:YtxH-like protein n=1 Tax=Mariniblastus fucicola TaxID=980251 RepID=A0A5B9P230_9BACT|nr:hypothetical protein [Mariniblastus fucicola]QEG20378.1 hypothetical protein MFFC18_02260 [Mariniblastus fucicola]
MASNLKHDRYYAVDNENGAASADTNQSPGAVQECVQENPVNSALLVIGLGVGAGLLLSTLFSSERTRRERLTRRVGDYLQSGTGNLRSTLENVIPDRYMS